MEKEIIFKSTNGIDDLSAIIWDCPNPKFILQICHGMSEHIGRYKDFAEFLNSHGIIVAGNNHLGHGKTANILGYFNSKDFVKTLVDDVYELSKYLQNQYKLKIYYLGHSMGSFILRAFLAKYNTEKAIIMGTAYVNKFLAKLLIALSDFIGKLKGYDSESDFLYFLTIGRYSLITPKNQLWISYNLENIYKCKDDKYSGFPFKVSGYKALGSLLSKIIEKNTIQSTDKNTKILFISGSDDLVGKKEKGVLKVSSIYKKEGFKNIEIELYKNMKHEILNEYDNLKVYNRILEFLEK
ncbi:MAG: alpha/beta fold hydrolase [Peptoniphilaceae bacterium]